MSIPDHYHSVYRVQIQQATDTIALFCCHLSFNNLLMESSKWESLKEGRRLRKKEVDMIYNSLKQEHHLVS